MKLKKINKEKLFFNLLSIVIIIVLWELMANYYAKKFENGSYLLPSIYSIIKNSYLNISAFYGMGGLGTGQYNVEFSYLLSAKVIGYHTGLTFGRIIGGFTLGVVLGILSGTLYKANNYFRALSSWPSRILNIVPQMALITLFIVWFGSTEIGYIMFIAFGVFVAIYINTINAIENLPPIYFKYSKSLGASNARYYTNIVLPGIIPELAGGLKMIVGQAWALSMAAEFISANNGLGRIIVLARERMDTGIILIIIFHYVIYTIITLQLLYKLCDYLTRWMPKMESKTKNTEKYIPVGNVERS